MKINLLCKVEPKFKQKPFHLFFSQKAFYKFYWIIKLFFFLAKYLFSYFLHIDPIYITLLKVKTKSHYLPLYSYLKNSFLHLFFLNVIVPLICLLFQLKFLFIPFIILIPFNILAIFFPIIPILVRLLMAFKNVPLCVFLKPNPTILPL